MKVRYAVVTEFEYEMDLELEEVDQWFGGDLKEAIAYYIERAKKVDERGDIEILDKKLDREDKRYQEEVIERYIAEEKAIYSDYVDEVIGGIK